MKQKIFMLAASIAISTTAFAQKKVKLEDNSNASNFYFKNNKVGISVEDPKESLDIIGSIGFRGIDNSLPSKYWELYNNANSGAEYGLTFKYDNKVAMFLDIDRSLNLKNVLKFVGNDPFSVPGNKWQLYHNANENNDYGLTFKFNNDVKIRFNEDSFRFNGLVKATELKIQQNVLWPDFVFKSNYNLPTLKQVEAHIKANGHLQGIPSEAQVLENGIQVGDMVSKLLQKIEELTLYTIEQEKRLNAQQKEIETLKNKN